jgi:hypothetical protein
LNFFTSPVGTGPVGTGQTVSKLHKNAQTAGAMAEDPLSDHYQMLEELGSTLHHALACLLPKVVANMTLFRWQFWNGLQGHRQCYGRDCGRQTRQYPDFSIRLCQCGLTADSTLDRSTSNPPTKTSKKFKPRFPF